MASVSPTSPTAKSHRKHVRSVSSVDVKSGLRDLMASTKPWREFDAKANGLLYNLLGTIYDLNNGIASAQAKRTLRDECAKCERITKSRMWNVDKRPVLDLLIAYVLGNADSKAPTRSQWKKVLLIGKKQEVPFKRTAFSKWLHDSGGIEGVLSGGKRKPANKAVIVDFNLETYASSFDPSALPLQLAIDLSETASFSDDTYTNDFALVLVRKTIDLETGKQSRCAVVDVVNDREMVEKAAQAISQRHNKKH